MESVATIKLKIPVREELLETMRQYSRACQEVIDWGFGLMTCDKRELHDLSYKSVRKKTSLPAQLVCSSRDRACEILKRSDFSNKPACKKFMTIRYDARSFSFKNGIVSLCSVKGRIKMPVEIPDYFKQYSSWKVNSADLILDRKNRLFIAISVSNQVDVDTRFCGNRKVVGIDLGINKLAVSSNCQFFKSGRIKKRKSEFRYLRSRLEAQGTRSAKRKLKKMSGKEKRFMAQINHEVSKNIVGNLGAGDIIVMESLTGIRKQRKGKRMNRWIHDWSFSQFQQFVTYKAQRKGIEVVKVAAKNTSKTCSNCGSLETSRHSGFIQCHVCRLSLDADLNASRNLVQRYMRNTDKALVNEPIVTSNAQLQAI